MNRAVKARIAIAVRSDGEWDSYGCSAEAKRSDDSLRSEAQCNFDRPEPDEIIVVHFVTAVLPVPDAPQPQELTAEVESDD